MNRNLLYLIIGALAVVDVVAGYLFYQEHQKTVGIDINVGNGSISVETKQFSNFRIAASIVRLVENAGHELRSGVRRGSMSA